MKHMSLHVSFVNTLIRVVSVVCGKLNVCVCAPLSNRWCVILFPIVCDFVIIGYENSELNRV